MAGQTVSGTNWRIERVQMDIYENFHRMAKSHVATIRECEVLTDEIVKSARTFIDNCHRWDSCAYGKVLNTLRKRILSDIYEAEYQIEYEKRFQEPTSTNSYEYGNEIAFREADRLAKEVVRELKGKSIEQIYNILKGYR